MGFGLLTTHYSLLTTPFSIDTAPEICYTLYITSADMFSVVDPGDVSANSAELG